MSEVIVTTPEALVAALWAALRCYEEEKDKSPQSDWMTPREAAEYLKIAYTSIHKLTSSESIPYCRVGRSLRFSRRALDQWMEDSV